MFCFLIFKKVFIVNILIKQYKLFKKMFQVSFVQAWFLCEEKNWKLVTFETEEKFVALNDTFNLWAVDDQRVNENKHMTYTNWGTNEPEYNRDSTYCIQLGNFRSSQISEPRQWSAQLCETQNLYICEVPVQFISYTLSNKNILRIYIFIN